jgi:hypothetical protein
VLFIVENGGVQHHFIDIALEGVFAVVAANGRGALAWLGCGHLSIRRGHGVTVDVQRTLFFRLRHLRHGWAWQAAKQGNR